MGVPLMGPGKQVTFFNDFNFFSKKWQSVAISQLLTPELTMGSAKACKAHNSAGKASDSKDKDRLIRTVIEEGLNQLPYTEEVVTTPTGQQYNGLRYQKGNCGVSIVRSGEAMEKALQDCCRSMRIGKILVDSDTETHEARVIFAKFPADIAQRKVLLLYPIMRTGNKVSRAVQVLIEHKVPQEHIILINLFCTPSAAQLIVQSFPNLNVLTTELHEVTPNHFGERYFGTEHSEYEQF